MRRLLQVLTVAVMVVFLFGSSGWFSPVRAAPMFTDWPAGDISTAVVWSAANNPYVVNGRINIVSGGSLTIGPGVIVQFSTSGGGFMVFTGGSLITQGAEGNVVTLTAANTGTPWDSIILSGGTLNLNYTDISYAAAGYSSGSGVLYLYSSDVQVRNTTLHNNNSVGIYMAYDQLTPTFENVTVQNNTGIPIYQSYMTDQPVYTNITLTGNTAGDFVYINNGSVSSQDAVLDGTGLNGLPFHLGSNISVSKMLTIVPGTEVRLGENRRVEVNNGGTLIAEGSVAAPITFDAVDPATPWDSIIVSPTGIASLNYCDISHASANYSSGHGVLYLYSSDVQVRNTVLHDNSSMGINIAYDQLTPTFENVTIQNNTGLPIFQSYMTDQPVFTNVVMQGNTAGDFLYINNGDVSSQDAILDLSGLNGKPVHLGSNIRVFDTFTLTIVPGADIRLGQNLRVEVNNGGTLIAEGMALEPITFDAVDSATPWDSIIVSPTGIASLDYCEISNASANYSSGHGVLYLYSSDVQVRNTILHDNASMGINIAYDQLTPTFENVTIQNNTGLPIFQSYMTDQPVYTNVVMQGNTPGDFLYIANGNVSSQDAVLDLSGLNGKPVHLDSNIGVSKTLTIVPGTEVQMGPGTRVEVFNGGTLIAEGTAAQPIQFTAVDPATPWNSIIVSASGTARLNYCDISNANGGYSSGHGVLYTYSSSVQLRNSRIHDNASYAVFVDYDSHPLIRGNQFDHNTYGLYNNDANVYVDARFNYWGDPSGPYHPTSNPAGLGQQVSDRVLYAPWYEDTLGTLTQKVLLQIAGPARASSGEKLTYQVYYYAGQALEDAVLVFSLPETATFVSTGPDGVYMPERSQVYWNLGDLPAQSEGVREVYLQAMWNLPNNYPDAASAVMGSPSLDLAPYSIDTAAYTAYAPITVTSTTILTGPQIDFAVQNTPGLTELYDAAIAGGFKRMGGSILSASDGNQTTQIWLINGEKQAVMSLRFDHASAASQSVTFTATSFTIADPDGGAVLDLSQNLATPLGNWDMQSGGMQLVSLAEISPFTCWRNCMLQAAGMWAISKLSNTVDSVMKTKDCVLGLTGDGDSAANCFLALEKVTKLVPGISEIKETTKCTAECANPLKRANYVCSGSLTSVEPPTWAWLNPVSWTESGQKRQYVRYTCNTTTGMWGKPEILYCPPGYVAQAGANDSDGHPCVPANDLVGFAYGEPDRKVPSTRTGLMVRRAKDPNAKYGLYSSTQFAILPDQTITYTITYENEGEGNAYGVFILDTLSADLDEATLNLGGNGQYYPASRQVAWDIGELAPKGEVGSTGSVSFTIQPRAGLAVGTVISNQAVVYFPSVPEETPTNAVFSTISPAVAIPQEVVAVAETPLPITLGGSGPGTLTFAVIDQPVHGAVAGTPPALTYTAYAGYAGEDFFTFEVTGSAGTSLPAQVRITVGPNLLDTAPPAVVWISPQDGSVLPAPVPASFTDTLGTGYYPLITVQFSEALDPATITAEHFTLSAGGGALSFTVAYVDGQNRVILIPREPLPTDALISVGIGPAVEDLNGNPMAQVYSSTFTLAKAQEGFTVFLPLLQK